MPWSLEFGNWRFGFGIEGRERQRKNTPLKNQPANGMTYDGSIPDGQQLRLTKMAGCLTLNLISEIIAMRGLATEENRLNISLFKIWHVTLITF